MLLRVLFAENLFHSSQRSTDGFRSRKTMELNPYVKVYMVTSTSTQMQEQAVHSHVYRNNSNPHFDLYFWLWLADSGDTSDDWKRKLVHIEIWHKPDIGSDVFIGGTIVQLNGRSAVTKGLSLEKGCCPETTVELNSLADQHAEMRRIKEQFFGRSRRKDEDLFYSDEDDEEDSLEDLSDIDEPGGGGGGKPRFATLQTPKVGTCSSCGATNVFVGDCKAHSLQYTAFACTRTIGWPMYR